MEMGDTLHFTRLFLGPKLMDFTLQVDSQRVEFISILAYLDDICPHLRKLHLELGSTVDLMPIPGALRAFVNLQSFSYTSAIIFFDALEDLAYLPHLVHLHLVITSSHNFVERTITMNGHTSPAVPYP
ncbi:hypothetical protein AcW1_008386 [Taiwanofungus camphoratus]|nr:hypothetical protein AcV5_008678 [Antrodia cinnamomea]KAI0951318.1 hypothetical protein AcW1_008386 [Antrodia cinnamomea]KAI0956224.1 hypothetical protein AcV7_006674 [Antrodia cinnamomea]